MEEVEYVCEVAVWAEVGGEEVMSGLTSSMMRYEVKATSE